MPSASSGLSVMAMTRDTDVPQREEIFPRGVLMALQAPREKNNCTHEEQEDQGYDRPPHECCSTKGPGSPSDFPWDLQLRHKTVHWGETRQHGRKIAVSLLICKFGLDIF